jgi:aryl-alcohol dehydrogenase-like predicted oxidoreductase
MKSLPLSKTGLMTSPIVFGGNVFGWTADEPLSYRLLDQMVEAGLNTIDTADVYSRWADGNSGGESETVIGNWLAANPGKRDSVVLITKVGSDMGGEGEKGLKAAWIEKAVENSLSRLKTDVIDLYLSHWPDEDTSDEETLTAFGALLKAGKVRAIGTSNRDRAQMERAAKAAADAGLPRYDVLQPEYNLHARGTFEGPLADYCIDNDIGVITYFSLASGFLSGKYRSQDDVSGERARMVGKYLDDRGMRILAALDAIAADTGATQAEIALAWLRQKPGVTAPIASATKPAQLDSLIKAATLDLSDEAMAALDATL